MDTLVHKHMGERPLGHALVAVSELCAWSEAERLPYDFEQIIGNFKFVQAEFLFPIVAQWSTQHLSPEASQGIMGKRGETVRGHLIADDPSLSMWAVTGDAHNAFERLFYQAVNAGKLRLLDGITRMPINALTPESLDRIDELGGDADTRAAVKVEAAPDGKNPNKKPPQQQQFQEQEILRVIKELSHEPKSLPQNKQGKPGVKAEVRQKLTFTVKVFDKAWERLMASQDIQYAE